eukprot:41766-Eustigmatos_ZCMA.PRE.1
MGARPRNHSFAMERPFRSHSIACRPQSAQYEPSSSVRVRETRGRGSKTACPRDPGYATPVLSGTEDIQIRTSVQQGSITRSS